MTKQLANISQKEHSIIIYSCRYGILWMNILMR